THDLVVDDGPVADTLVDHDAVVAQRVRQLRAEVMRVDRAGPALVRSLLAKIRVPLVALALHRRQSLRRRLAELRRRLRLDRLEQLPEDERAVALEPCVR